MEKRGTVAAAIFAASLLAAVSEANGTEAGITLWPLGVQTVLPALQPPPGATEFYQYNLYYSASSFKNGQGQSVSPNISVDLYGNANRIAYTWPVTYGGFNFSSNAIIAEAAPTVGLGTFKQTNVGVSFLHLAPFYLTYNTENFHFMLGEAAFIPVSSYNPARLANASLNYYGFNQEIAVTWFPIPKLELSAEAVFTFNGRNPATGYLSGNIFDLDFGAGYRPFDAMPGLQIGLNGYLTEQISSDQFAGQNIGNYLRKFALGPQIVYFMTPAAGLAFKWQRELDVRNGPKGDRVWFQFAFPL